MSVLNDRAQAIEDALSGTDLEGLSPEAALELFSEWAEIGNALAEDGGAIDDPRSQLEIAMDLDDAEVMATRASDYP